MLMACHKCSYKHDFLFFPSKTFIVIEVTSLKPGKNVLKNKYPSSNHHYLSLSVLIGGSLNHLKQYHHSSFDAIAFLLSFCDVIVIN